MAKKYLDNLREDAHKAVHDMGFMNPTVDNVLHMDVLPWLKQKAEAFVNGSESSVKHATELLDEGVLECQRQHAATLQKKRDAEKRQRQAEIEAKRQTQ